MAAPNGPEEQINMAGTRYALESATIVVRGRFNPAIFSPQWFLDTGLVGRVEFESAEIEIISPSLAVFSLGWLKCQVSEDALQISTGDVEEFERLRDVVIGVLRVLIHTPINALGMNRDMHIQGASREQIDRIGDAITPKDIWEPLLPLAAMRGVTMWGSRGDLYGGFSQVKVEPSLRLPSSVYISHNDHYDLTRLDAPRESRLSAFDSEAGGIDVTAKKIPIAEEVLAANWSSSLATADNIADRIISLGEFA